MAGERRHLELHSNTAIAEAKVLSAGLQMRMLRLSHAARPLIFGHHARVHLVFWRYYSTVAYMSDTLDLLTDLEILPSCPVARLTHRQKIKIPRSGDNGKLR